ncbi:unnamed protein product [Urochloa humidicola]
MVAVLEVRGQRRRSDHGAAPASAAGLQRRGKEDFYEAQIEILKKEMRCMSQGFAEDAQKLTERDARVLPKLPTAVQGSEGTDH